MSKPTIRELVDRGRVLVKSIEKDKEELKTIAAAIEEIAVDGPHVALEEKEREGKQYLAHGTTHIVPVLFTSDHLVKTFPSHSPLHNAIHKAAGGKMLRFFTPLSGYKTAIDDGLIFRKLAAKELGALAPEFISACLRRTKDGIPVSDTKIDWDREKEIAP